MILKRSNSIDLSTIRFIKYTFLLILIWQSLVFAQEPVTSKSNTKRQSNPSLLSSKGDKKSVRDSLTILKKDSVALDSLNLKKNSDDFDAQVDYTADGKILFFNSANKIFMYKNAKVKYKDIELTADYIELNKDS